MFMTTNLTLEGTTGEISEDNGGGDTGDLMLWGIHDTCKKKLGKLDFISTATVHTVKVYSISNNKPTGWEELSQEHTSDKSLAQVWADTLAKHMLRMMSKKIERYL